MKRLLCFLSFFFLTALLNIAVARADTEPDMDQGPLNLPTVWYSVADRGNWNNHSTWNSQPDGTGSSGSPKGTDQAIIQMGDTVEVFANNRKAGAIAIEGALDIDSNSAGHNFGVLTGSGTLIVGSVLPSYDVSSTFFNSGTTTYESPNSYTLPVSPNQYYNLVMHGSGTRETGGELLVTNDVRIEGGVLDIKGNDLTVSGDWYNNAGVNAFQSTGKVTFNSSSRTQTIYGITSFNDLVVDKVSETLVMGDSLLVANDFTISSGTVNSGSATLFIGNDWENDGTYQGTGTVVFNGSNAIHAIRGTANTAFNHLVIDGSGNTLEFGNNASLLADLTVNSGTFTIGGLGLVPVTVPGNLTINSDGLLNATSTSTLIVGGNWTNKGTFTHGLNKVVYNGSDSQTLTGETIFYSIEKTGGGTLNLTDSCTVLGTLTLTDGNVHTTDTSMLVLSINANISGGSTDSYVDGPLTHAVSLAPLLDEMRLFPFGSNGKYRPASLTVDLLGTTGTAYYRGELHEGPPPSRTLPLGIDHVSSVRYYTISQYSLLPLSLNVVASVDIAYNDDDIVDTPSDLRLVKSDGSGNWLDIGGTGSGLVGSITSNTFTSFSDFVAGSSSENNPLPIELVSLDARQQAQQISIEWITASETNNSHFVVERTQDGKNYQAVATVAGAGDSQQKKSYQAWDHAPLLGTAYYRVMQVDYDGQYTYTRPVSVEFEILDRIEVQLRPNPASTETTVAIHGLLAEAEVHIQLIDPVGQVVAQYQHKVTMPSLEVPISDLSHRAPGIYTVVVQSDSFRWAEKLIVK